MTITSGAPGLSTRLVAGEHHLVWTGGTAPEPSHDEFVLNNPDGPEADARIKALEEALKAARWYVADHQESQPNAESRDHLKAIDELLT